MGSVHAIDGQLADFNNDGKLDFVVASQINSDDVGVVLGNGAGGFGSPASTAVGAPSADTLVTDLNGDGNLDVIVVDGLGTGGFSPP
jgi:hypothetical protein